MGGSKLLFRIYDCVTIQLEIARIFLSDRQLVLHSLPVFAFIVHGATI